MTKIRVTIQADTNDADYIQSDLEYTIEDYNKHWKGFFERWAKALDECSQRHNFPYGDVGWSDTPVEELYGSQFTEEELEDFKEMVPYGEYGIHTIVSIDAVEIGEIQNIYQRKWVY